MKTASKAWLESINEVASFGDINSPRGMKTIELMNQSMTFDMNYPICHHDKRKLSYKFMAAEAYWITSGSALVEEIEPYNKHIAEYSDDGYIFNGAYGPIFDSQVNYVVQALANDFSTRQAVMTIWHPNPSKSKDIKCTIALAFNIRNEQLHTTVLMRSNDLILGRPYDMFNFTVMTLRILTQLNIKFHLNIDLGYMTFHTVSAHYYEKHFDLVSDMLDNTDLYIKTARVPSQARYEWKYVTRSLLWYMHTKASTIPLIDIWKIRPENEKNCNT